MKKLLLAGSLILSAFSFSAQAQSNQAENVFVQSWKKGKETIGKQVIRVLLNDESKGFKTDIVSKSGKHYLLTAIHNPIRGLKGEHWKVELREVIFEPGNNKEVYSDNLLTQSNLPPDYSSSREEYVNYFYPNEEKMVIINKVPKILAVGNDNSLKPLPFYLTKVVRNIKVEQFLVTLKAGNYSFTEKNKNKLNSFEIFVEFDEVDDSNIAVSSSNSETDQ